VSLPTKTFEQFVDDMVAAWSAQLGFTPTLQDGDALLALMRSVSSQALFLQAQAMVVNEVARAQTSTGADLDTFCEQFGVYRHTGSAALGEVIFSKFTAATSQVLVVPGVVVQTVGGAIQYQVIADTAQPSWSVAQNAYVLQIGDTSLTASVQALEVGSAYDVTANQLAQIATPVPGIDSVTNPGPIQNGTDNETDADYRARFVLFLNSLSKATYGAVYAAVQGQAGVTALNLEENIDLSRATRPGEFIATVDDGSGSAPSSLVAAVQAALEPVRGFTILALARAATKVEPTVTLNIKVASGYTPTSVQAAAQAAVVAAINAQPIGGPLYVATVIEAAGATAGVVSVQASTVLINGENDDLDITGFQVVKATLDDVTVGTY